jgi:hypothetical protein
MWPRTTTHTHVSDAYLLMARRWVLQLNKGSCAPDIHSREMKTAGITIN